MMEINGERMKEQTGWRAKVWERRNEGEGGREGGREKRRVPVGFGSFFALALLCVCRVLRLETCQAGNLGVLIDRATGRGGEAR